jgi:hypothetical protein
MRLRGGDGEAGVEQAPLDQFAEQFLAAVRLNGDQLAFRPEPGE